MEGSEASATQAAPKVELEESTPFKLFVGQVRSQRNSLHLCSRRRQVCCVKGWCHSALMRIFCSRSAAGTVGSENTRPALRWIDSARARVSKKAPWPTFTARSHP